MTLRTHSVYSTPLPVHVGAAPRSRPRLRPLLCVNSPEPTGKPPCKPLDKTLELAMPWAKCLPPLSGMNMVLGAARRPHVQSVASRYCVSVERLTPGVVNYDPDSIAAYDCLMQRALKDLRTQHLTPHWVDLLAQVDRYVYANNEELSDDAATPMAERLHIIDTLNALNQHTGNYERWAEPLQKLWGNLDTRRPVHLVDLAAGTGGFALALKRQFGDGLHVTATDLVRDYLDIGQARAESAGLAITFAQQDATRLDNFRDQSIDLFTCTQSLHHFSPGVVGRIFAEGLRMSKLGVCCIDGERDVLPMAMVTCIMALYGRRWPVVYDTVTSLRRMYALEELELIARLAPGAPKHVLFTQHLRPAHTVVTLRRTSEDTPADVLQ